MLHAMFSGRFDTKPAEDGSYFIDRDGTHFRYNNNNNNNNNNVFKIKLINNTYGVFTQLDYI